MANLALIKELAQLQKRTLEDIAQSVGIGVQTIYLMVRTGSTKLDTLEKVAKELKVPPSVFLDDNFDVEEYRRVVIKGRYNPSAFFGGTAVVNAGVNSKLTQEILKSKEEATSMLREQLNIQRDQINDLRNQISDLRADKDRLLEDKRTLIAEIEELKQKCEKS